jgi:hypothetical protein
MVGSSDTLATPCHTLMLFSVHVIHLSPQIRQNANKHAVLFVNLHPSFMAPVKEKEMFQGRCTAVMWQNRGEVEIGIQGDRTALGLVTLLWEEGGRGGRRGIIV